MADLDQGSPPFLPGIPSDPRLLADAAATRTLGRQLARMLQPACRPGRAPLLLLLGDLGAGKTSLVQGLAEELGINEAITSPTFALAHHYAGLDGAGSATALVHLDLYRLEAGPAADELFAQEEEEALALGALMAVEWPERLSALPPEAWEIQLGLACVGDPDAGRLARITAPASVA